MARLAPYTFVQEMDNNGDPLVGGKLYTYSAGTSTPKATYTDSTGGVTNANPIILDSSGRANIWLSSGAYKFILKTSADVTISTVDNVAGDSENAFGSQVITQSTNLSITSAHRNAAIFCTTSLQISLDAAVTLGEGFYFSVSNVGTGTVTVDPNGSETFLGSGDLTLTVGPGQSATIVCNGTGWYVLFYYNGFTTGDTKATYKTTADPGWVMMNDGTIGSASSGATTRANLDTLPLYTVLWNGISDTYAPVSGGRGANAAADFAANKTLGLPKVLGRSLAIAGAGFGLTSRVLGFTVGEETHVLITAELPAHTHTITDPGHVHDLNITGQTGLSGSGNDFTTDGSPLARNSNSATTGITINNTGSDTAHNNMQPTAFLNAMIKL